MNKREIKTDLINFILSSDRFWDTEQLKLKSIKELEEIGEKIK